jgi:hypothetical protein
MDGGLPPCLAPVCLDAFDFELVTDVSSDGRAGSEYMCRSSVR